MWQDKVSNDTKVMINKLRELKDKEKKAKKISTWMLCISFFLVMLFMYLVNQTTKTSKSNEIFEVLSAIIQQKVYIYLLVGIVSTYSIHRHYEKQALKHKNKLKTHRQEVMEHLQTTWYITKYSKLRDEISEDLEKRGVKFRFKS